MPLLSSFLLIESAAVTLFAVSVLLVTSPATILGSTTLSLLGSSMHIRPATFTPDSIPSSRFSSPLNTFAHSTKSAFILPEQELIALLGLIIGIVSFSTLVLAAPLYFSRSALTTRTTSEGKTLRKSSPEVGESIAKLTLTQSTWQTLAGIHVVVAASFVAWIYLFRSEKYGRGAGPVKPTLATVTAEGTGGLSVLANNVTFTIGIIDMLFWGYLYTTIKEERRVVLQVMEKRRTEDEEDHANRPM